MEENRDPFPPFHEDQEEIAAQGTNSPKSKIIKKIRRKKKKLVDGGSLHQGSQSAGNRASQRAG